MQMVRLDSGQSMTPQAFLWALTKLMIGAMAHGFLVGMGFVAVVLAAAAILLP